MKLIMTLMVMAVLGLASFAQAQDVDFSKVKCSEFLNSGEANIQNTMIWLDGYVSALSDNTVMSTEWMKEFGTHMGTYCTKNPNSTILEAVDAME